MIGGHGGRQRETGVVLAVAVDGELFQLGLTIPARASFSPSYLLLSSRFGDNTRLRVDRLWVPRSFIG